MKKILILFILVSALSGCSLKSNDDDQKIKIVVSFYVLEYLTQRIGGEFVSITNLLPTAGEPHDYEPSTKDMVTLSKANHIFILGNQFEPWFDDVSKTIYHKRQEVLVVSQGIPTIVNSTTNQIDPHVWTSLRNNVVMLNTIKNELIRIDPDHKIEYEANYQAAKAEFETLDQEFIEVLKNRVRDEFVVNHAAFGYLAKDYGLNMIPIMGIEPDAQPNASMMAKIIDIVKQYDIPYILYEDDADTEVADTIAAETGALTGVLRPGESLNVKQIANGDDFLSIMRQNLQWLKKALT
ncbi:MAG: zinc transport system substrate-binding protein [Erysipelotrichaceae bacterium]|nr:MAG: zinc transport system substrate-binding [Erysipelotrichaceae bacterium]TXT18025.1 MAG: zinc transport system substrate-binding protein [Erysipelotrichaceae bacterium]